MTVYVVDGQGGGIGRTLSERIKNELLGVHIVALGSNAMATAAMLKGGAHAGATGENALVHCCAGARETDAIAGPIGIMISNSMLGEFSPAMACAVAESRARKILIPIPASRCRVSVAGVSEKTLGQYIDDAIALLGEMRVAKTSESL